MADVTNGCADCAAGSHSSPDEHNRCRCCGQKVNP